ncbi:glutaminyl-peptide cyclotransferase [Longimicrobium sp.]|uniref:glutaminyl-peptide cyclotransferase n=1 Tax=Longimicrobium sp. TaxID=2029185 RepID=UPI002CAFFA0D|nr:glutaminyl-peptide cyclotransferase [Longimicrobium sp.]HSU17244.1 glutaminyl-peptide cyclotransferase [Longimicrobium sp.]
MIPGLRRAGRPAALLTLATLAFCACDRKGGIDKDPGVNEPPRPVAPVTPATVLRSFPHDTAAFTQGLLWHEGWLYESTGREGRSTLRQVELETGKVLRKADIPSPYFAEGLALFEGRLYQLTWQNQQGFIYTLGDFRQAGTFPYQGEGWGLTTDGKSLILSDGSNELRVLDPRTFAVQRTVEVMDGTVFVNDINELEWVKGEIWANVWHTDRIARIDPQTGKVKAWVDLTGILETSQHPDPEAVLNGIAYDEAHDRLFVTGKLWPTLFEISVPGVAGGGGAAAR